MSVLKFIVSKTNLKSVNVTNTVELLDQGCTIPFIARYRKEQTGALDEVEIGDILKYKTQFEELEKRKISILKAIEEQNDLTAELNDKINAAEDLNSLEDIYLPFKKKRNTKAEKARLNGLEPLAKIIMVQNARDLPGLAKKYLNAEVGSVDEALEGARFIIAEWMNERIDIRNLIRFQLDKFGVITSKVVKSVLDDEKSQKYLDYFNWSENLSKCPSHRLLAMLRAENEGVIRVKVELDDAIVINKIESRVIKFQNESSEQIKLAITDAYKRLLFPSLSNEILKKYKEISDEKAITVFSKNLKQLLLGAPLGEKRILAIDPGFKSGCKIVCLNEQGGLEYNETIYPHPPQNDSIGAIKKINSLVDAYKIEAIAIGNGTASRETEHLIKRMRFYKDVEVFVVSEAGASIYSASKIARDEFPNFDITVRGAISIGRRLADPLAELVKIDAKSIGVGQYQHDVDQLKLKNELDRVVESSVNLVGVNVNTASASLLSYVSGIGPKLAESVVAYREQINGFKNRSQIKLVPRLGEKVFEQCAGFLRIKDGDNLLDNSAVHPESYKLVETMLKDLKIELASLIGNKEILRNIDPKKYVTNNIGLETVMDVLKELEKPGLDPRLKAKAFSFNENINSINDLREGQLLPGIVNNITNFGCFVDIGIKESGLVHVSNLADKFVSDVNEVVSLGEQVVVKVLEVDTGRKRIQLSLKIK